MKIILALSLVLAVNVFHKHEHPVVKKDVSGSCVESFCPVVSGKVSEEFIPASSNDEKATDNSSLGGKNFMAGVVMM